MNRPTAVKEALVRHCEKNIAPVRPPIERVAEPIQLEFDFQAIEQLPTKK